MQLVVRASLRFLRTPALLLALVVAASCAPASQGGATDRPGSSIVARVQYWKNAQSVEYFMESARLAGVSTVHLITKQDEDDTIPSGTAFYQSTIAPVWRGADGWDPLRVAVEEAHKRGIKIYAWMPQFHDQVAARAHPEWEMQVAKGGVAIKFSETSSSWFVNPIDPEVRDYERSLVEEVLTNYEVDGIDLDWVRYDNQNMDVGPVSRAAAEAEIGIDPLTLNFDAGLRDPDVVRWQVWRSAIIAEHVASIRASLNQIRPAAHLAAFVLPQSFWEVGQNLALFANSLDEVEPMCYWRDWGYPPSWVVTDCLQTVDARIAKAHAKTVVIPTIGADEPADETATVLADLKRVRPNLIGIAWFSYDAWSRVKMSEATALLAGY